MELSVSGAPDNSSRRWRGGTRRKFNFHPFDFHTGRGKKDKKGNYPGLYLDDIIKMVVVRCVKTVMSTNGFTNIKMGLGAAGNQLGAGIAGGANAVNNTAVRGGVREPYAIDVRRLHIREVKKLAKPAPRLPRLRGQ